MHVFPQLRKLEEKYRKELAVIGVHSAKFPTEQETDNVRMAILRYEIGHPVINDSQFQVWQSYACRAWPTLMFLDPQGRVMGRHEGEIPYEVFDNLLGEMVREYDSQGLLDRGTLDFRLETPPSTPLSFPGKVLADEASGRLFVSDSNHNRVLEVTLEGEVVRTIGGVTPAFEDGDLVVAAFDHPQGLALDGNFLYVADTENHAIRRVDLVEGYVDTLAGTGRQAPRGFGGGPARDSSLNSPWDLVLHQGILCIAMAGNHQLWALDLAKSRVASYAGSGRENIVDGPLASAQLAQPSGVTTDGEKLYFADSETSSIRSADLKPDGWVSTIVGQGLFEFGDVDGMGSKVRLQHPMGIDWWEGVLYITDSYNHKVKRVDPNTQSVTTFLGTGQRGSQDGAAQEASFYEPGGLSAAGGRLYIADTNNHAIRVADLETGAVETLELRGL
jgi:DNA-binding beta-propeller fold protein YncE